MGYEFSCVIQPPGTLWLKLNFERANPNRVMDGDLPDISYDAKQKNAVNILECIGGYLSKKYTCGEIKKGVHFISCTITSNNKNQQMFYQVDGKPTLADECERDFLQACVDSFKELGFMPEKSWSATHCDADTSHRRQGRCHQRR